jgi:hypothetical protein
VLFGTSSQAEARQTNRKEDRRASRAWVRLLDTGVLGSGTARDALHRLSSAREAHPGMTTIALTPALPTLHRQMPNIVLQPDDRRDVIAYILSLK